MNDTFDLVCDGFSATGDDVTFSFMYSIAEKDNGKSFFLGEELGSDTVELAGVFLPAGKVTLTALACNPYDACIEAQFDEVVTVEIGDITTQAVR